MFNKLPLAIALTAPFFLASCGGGSDSASNSSSVNAPDIIVPNKDTPTSKPDITPPIQDSVPEPEPDDSNVIVDDVEGISEILIANDTPLPQLPANTNPLSLLDINTNTELFSDGIYENGLSYIFDYNNYMEIDCPTGSDTPCPSITNYRYDPDQKRIISKHWAYMPIQKIWIELENSSEFITLPEFSLYALDLVSNQPINDLKFLDTPSEIAQNSLNYKFGESIFEVSGIKSNLTNQSFYSSLSDSMATYSKDAKQYKLFSELTEGEVFIQNEMGELGIYGSPVKFRNSHVSLDDAICFNGDYLVFKPKSLGATTYHDYSGQYICDPFYTLEEPVSFSSLSISSHYEEGVKTLDGAKLLYLANHGGDTSDTSSLQYLPVFHISAAGVARQGIALQEGYAFEDDKLYYNKAAIRDWLKTKYNEPEALNLPSL